MLMLSVNAMVGHVKKSKAVSDFQMPCLKSDSDFCKLLLTLLCKRFLSHNATSRRTQTLQLLLNAQEGRRLLKLQDKFYQQVLVLFHTFKNNLHYNKQKVSSFCMPAEMSMLRLSEQSISIILFLYLDQRCLQDVVFQFLVNKH